MRSTVAESERDTRREKAFLRLAECVVRRIKDSSIRKLKLNEKKKVKIKAIRLRWKRTCTQSGRNGMEEKVEYTSSKGGYIFSHFI